MIKSEDEGHIMRFIFNFYIFKPYILCFFNSYIYLIAPKALTLLNLFIFFFKQALLNYKKSLHYSRIRLEKIETKVTVRITLLSLSVLVIVMSEILSRYTIQF